MIFFDASAVVKAYVNELGSPMVHAALACNQSGSFLTPAVVLEVLATFAKRRRANTLSRTEYRTAREAFLQALSGLFEVLDIQEGEYTVGYELVDRYRRINASAMDVLHISSALCLEGANQGRALVIASCDRGFLSLARAEGLRTFDPESGNLGTLLHLMRSQESN